MHARRSFDSTYEGLKLRALRAGAAQPVGFDSTYEGLKPRTLLDVIDGDDAFRQYL